MKIIAPHRVSLFHRVDTSSFRHVVLVYYKSEAGAAARDDWKSGAEELEFRSASHDSFLTCGDQ